MIWSNQCTMWWQRDAKIKIRKSNHYKAISHLKRDITAPNSFWNVARLVICAAFRHFKWYLSSLLLLQFWICTFFCRRYSRRKWHLIDRVSCLYLLVKSVKNCIFAILNSINSISIRFYSLWIEVTILLVSQHSRQLLSRQWNDAVFTPRLCLAV